MYYIIINSFCVTGSAFNKVNVDSDGLYRLHSSTSMKNDKINKGVFQLLHECFIELPKP